jgi:hypothetical protein
MRKHFRATALSEVVGKSRLKGLNRLNSPREENTSGGYQEQGLM